jgi:hypothetical protein
LKGVNVDSNYVTRTLPWASVRDFGARTLDAAHPGNAVPGKLDPDTEAEPISGSAPSTTEKPSAAKPSSIPAPPRIETINCSPLRSSVQASLTERHARELDGVEDGGDAKSAGWSDIMAGLGFGLAAELAR